MKLLLSSIIAVALVAGAIKMHHPKPLPPAAFGDPAPCGWPFPPCEDVPPAQGGGGN